jgi:hypothetical protein
MSDSQAKAALEWAELITIAERDRIRQWLISNNIIRPAMDQRDGYVALDCYTGQPFTFTQLGATDGNNK